MKKLLITSIAILALLGLGFGTLHLSNSRTFQVYGNLVAQVETEQKLVALTFDDGPTANTGEVLELLAELNVPATFFVTGSELEQYPQEGAMLVAAGHELGNHSWSHKRMVFKSPQFIREEIERTDELIRAAGHQGPIHFRPPNGKKLVLLPRYLHQQDRYTIMWNLEPDSSDPGVSAEVITAEVLANIEPGSIILLHVMYNSRHESRAALEGIVTGLRARGYTFVTVSQLLDSQ